MEPRDPRRVVVAGGANIDVKARSRVPVVLGTSNPGTTTTSPGGVARNVAEGLARLGSRVHLLTAVGRDAPGDRLLSATSAAGVEVSSVHRSSYPTGSYTAVLDEDGELVVAVSDMTAVDALHPEDLGHAGELLQGSGICVVDGNLPLPVLDRLLDLAARARVPTVVEPVSAPKAMRLVPLLVPERPTFVITPDRAELAALSGRPTGSSTDLNAATAELHRRGVRHVWVRLGSQGSLLSSHDGTRERLPALPTRVVDVTGAGDSMLAAFVDAVLRGLPLRHAARLGHAAAALTIADTRTVRPDLTRQALEHVLAAQTH